MKLLVSAYTDRQHRKPQLLLYCQSLTLNYAVHVKLWLVHVLRAHSQDYNNIFHYCIKNSIKLIDVAIECKALVNIVNRSRENEVPVR